VLRQCAGSPRCTKVVLRVFYDHDTMRIEIPCVFSQLGLIDEMKLTIGNSLNLQEVDLQVFGSSLFAFERGSISLLNQCDVAAFSDDGFRDITLSLERRDFANLCFEETDSMVWELMITPNVERSEHLERNSFSEEGIRLIAQEKVENCFENVGFQKSNY
jgi:hypothetical protein